jgi:hypothetical protein
MEAIENNLSPEFKQELEKGNINISTAHELSRLDEAGQAKAYEKYKEKGELHINDVKQDTKPEITDEQVEQAQEAIKDAIKGEVNRAVFKVKNDVAAVEKTLRKYFENAFSANTLKADGKEFIYRFQVEGMTLIDKSTWQNYIIEYSDLAEIVVFMIEGEELTLDNTVEEKEEIKSTEKEQESIFTSEPENEAEEDSEQSEDESLPGQQDISDYPQAVPEVEEKGLSFTEWIGRKYGTGQYNMIKKEVRAVIMSEAENGNMCPAEWEDRITNALSVWVMKHTKDYQNYLQG